MTYPLTDIQVQYLRDLAATGHYDLAYSFCAEILDEAVEKGQVDRGMQRWFEWAEQINGHPESLAHRYARTFSQMSASDDGITLTHTDFKNASDKIAAQVIERIATQSYIPTHARDIIIDDIRAGSRAMGTDPEDFPGTLTASILFGAPAHSEMIWNNPNMTFDQKLDASAEQFLKHALLLPVVAAHGLAAAGTQAIDVIRHPARLAEVPGAALEVGKYMIDGIQDLARPAHNEQNQTPAPKPL